MADLEEAIDLYSLHICTGNLGEPLGTRSNGIPSSRPIEVGSKLFQEILCSMGAAYPMSRITRHHLHYLNQPTLLT